MLSKAFEAQCAAVSVHCTDQRQRQKAGLTLFALALGSFCIGTSEFASMGILQLFSASAGRHERDNSIRIRCRDRCAPRRAGRGSS